MTLLGRTAAAMAAAVALATTGRAQPTRADTGTIATFAREWSTGLGTPRCERQGGWMGGGTTCTWGRAQSRTAPWLEYTPSEVRGAPAVVTWSRLASNPAHAQRMLDSLDRALVARGATRRSCGSGEVPAGTVTGTLWEGPMLAVLANRIDEPGGTARTYVVASDTPGVMSLDVMCPRRGDRARTTDTTRVRVPSSPAAIVFRPDSVVVVQSVAFAADSSLAILHYRMGRPIADSAVARRALAARLARPRSLDDDPIVQASAATPDGGRAEVRRLVVRPCWTDACAPPARDRLELDLPGDLAFVRRPDGSWTPDR